MKRRATDEQLARALLARLGEEVEAPGESELRTLARRASHEGRQPRERPHPNARLWRPLRLRWALGGATVLLLATGLGFGVASRLTPSGSARTSFQGLGFLPTEGWTVVQSGIPGSAESARAIAANVPLERANPRAGFAATALPSWPRWGIAIVATLGARGDPAVDSAFPVRALPLRFVDAVSVTPTEYVLRASVGGYNVDAEISFGSEPTPGMLREAEEQIARLVVAPAGITIAVRPTTYARDPLMVYGSVSSGKAGEVVTVQFRQCGLYPIQFRDAVELKTLEGGGWSTQLGIGANGVLRAVAGGDASNEVQVRARADVRLSPTRTGRYQVNVVERASFWRRRVVIQKLDRARGAWVKLRALVLAESGAAPGSAYVWSSTPTFTLPKGITVRAVLPSDQAKPCHIAGYSSSLRT